MDRTNNTNNKYIFELLLDFINSEQFACVGAKTAAALDSITHYDCQCVEQELTSVYRALETFTKDIAKNSGLNSTFVATFSGEKVFRNEGFEKFLWKMLKQLHEIDFSRGYKWSALCDRDVTSNKFAFSLVEHPFFIVGLNPDSERISRRFSFPAIAFNSHVQFEELKSMGIYSKMQHEIRKREIIIQGSINPMLSNFGDTSEARQYSGNKVTSNWKCPFNNR
ncbi:guanitoxin biosynthesis heme-dependent pre-guanitoxin N-hydroxylase GntA [Vibrio mediterranei]|uniref:guanitoxin biosynthesis heme-dependent pre-guanitoxin N-hydroxylase GntA n=1 Tax=Vibrio mediterranei TaxID=689 RepID=UPI00137472C3|nr:guanitoxin biosynthesis heme-dependent pre-guanitoxin N-hydroxylase GntA [Vibrio mediterranei]